MFKGRWDLLFRNWTIIVLESKNEESKMLFSKVDSISAGYRFSSIVNEQSLNLAKCGLDEYLVETATFGLIELIIVYGETLLEPVSTLIKLSRSQHLP